MYDPKKPYKNEIIRMIKETWETPFVSINDGLITRKFEGVETDSTDGIGNKGFYHWMRRSFSRAVLDGLLMNKNDLLMKRARAFKAQDHILIPEDDHEAIRQIVYFLTEDCKRHQIAVTGGETAIHNNLSGLEISVTTNGFVLPGQEGKKNEFQIGDYLVGIKSNGLHSNGFTKVIEVFGSEFRDEFVIPTRDYTTDVLHLFNKFDIHGLMHITGGAYTKLKDILPENADIRIKRDRMLKPQDIFYELCRRGVSDEEMYETFNCGVGFVLSASEHEAVGINNSIRDSSIIGEVVKGNGDVIIESTFSDKELIY